MNVGLQFDDSLMTAALPLTRGRFLSAVPLRWLRALSDKVSGFAPAPEGLIRLRGVAVAP